MLVLVIRDSLKILIKHLTAFYRISQIKKKNKEMKFILVT